MKAFTRADKLDEICRNCREYEADYEIGGMYGICRTAKAVGHKGKRTVKEANQYCDEVGA